MLRCLCDIIDPWVKLGTIFFIANVLIINNSSKRENGVFSEASRPVFRDAIRTIIMNSNVIEKISFEILQIDLIKKGKKKRKCLIFFSMSYRLMW